MLKQPFLVAARNEYKSTSLVQGDVGLDFWEKKSVSISLGKERVTLAVGLMKHSQFEVCKDEGNHITYMLQ